MTSLSRDVFLTITMETMPLAIVTVPSPLSVTVTSGPSPVPPPGRFAPAALGALIPAVSRSVRKPDKAERNAAVTHGCSSANERGLKSTQLRRSL